MYGEFGGGGGGGTEAPFTAKTSPLFSENAFRLTVRPDSDPRKGDFRSESGEVLARSRSAVELAAAIF